MLELLWPQAQFQQPFAVRNIYFKFVQTCTNLSRLVQTCPDLFRLVQTCSDLFRLVQTCPDLSRLVQTCPDLSRLVQACPDLFRLIHVHSSLLKLVLSCPNLFKHANNIQTNFFPASQTPFQLSFLTDQWTFSEASAAFKGFKLDYWETAC
jgi:hypothetical protein